MSQDDNNGVPVQDAGQPQTSADSVAAIMQAMSEKQSAEAGVSQEPEANQLKAEQPSVEKQVEEKPKPEPQNDEFSSKFAALSRKEKQIREQETALQQKLQEIEARQSEIEEKYGKYSNLDERIRNNPMELLQENGIDFETLTKMIIENEGKPTPEMEIKRLREEMDNKYMKQLEDLKAELAEKEQQKEEKYYDEVVENYKNELNEFIEQNAEQYELIKLNDASDLVYQVVEEHYNETGRVLSNEEASEHVENYLLEEAKKHLNVNKIKSLLGQQVFQEPKLQNPEQRAVNTLSNTESASVPSDNRRVLSDEESKREAAKLIRWVE